MGVENGILESIDSNQDNNIDSGEFLVQLQSLDDKGLDALIAGLDGIEKNNELLKSLISSIKELFSLLENGDSTISDDDKNKVKYLYEKLSLGDINNVEGDSITESIGYDSLSTGEIEKLVHYQITQEQYDDFICVYSDFGKDGLIDTIIFFSQVGILNMDILSGIGGNSELLISNYNDLINIFSPNDSQDYQTINEGIVYFLNEGLDLGITINNFKIASDNGLDFTWEECLAMGNNSLEDGLVKMLITNKSKYENVGFYLNTLVYELQGLLGNEGTQVINKLLNNLNSNPGNDSDILSKIALENGFYFNSSSETMGGDNFIEIDSKIDSKESQQWGKIFFGDKIDTSYYTLKDNNAEFSGISGDGEAILNESKVKADYEKNIILYGEYFGEYYSYEEYKLMIINNELTHKILKSEYNFDSGSNIDWKQIDSGISGFTPDNIGVHEFLSNVGSFHTNALILPTLIKNTLLSFDNINIGNKGLDIGDISSDTNVPGYEYSNRFLVKELNKIIISKGIDLSGKELTTELLMDSMLMDDYGKIQKAFIGQGNILLDRIKKT